MNNSTIVVFKGESQYDVLRFFSDYLGEGFESFGFTVEFVDLLQNDWIVNLTNLLTSNNKILFFLGMNGAGYDIKNGEISLYDYLNIPFISYYVDDPLHLYSRIGDSIKNIIHVFIDKTHKDFVDKYMNISNTKAFIPHGSKKVDIPIPSVDEKEIDVLVPGSFSNPDQIRDSWRSYDPHLSSILDDIAEEAYCNRDVHLMISAKSVFERNNIELQISNTKLFSLLSEIDLYVRSRMRMEIVNSLTDFKVLVCGNGWENNYSIPKNIKIANAVPFSEIPGLMTNSKMVLTVLPLFLYGGHERVFTAMSMGSVALVNKNQYFEEHLENYKDLVYFEWPRQDLRDIVQNLLDNPEQMMRISESAMEKALADHQWTNRAGEILKTFFIHKAVSEIKD
ncbi:glycosyltransferase [Paenibacillus silvae]|jgi:glycosyltransferase involved in cell wall biosynthesis|uniref:glycosyltransferase family protein n=1 Tax=Paenibacillus silvae TaxID=1325358 RepID=UPI0025A149D3|nr:glycosyltransferase [Paenibacillus silvae]MDM5281349.1 glycosyltransferase [Paenibacillus silvae]